MDRPEYFISCDWGTSNFRLKKVDMMTLDVQDEHHTDTGIKKCNEDYKNQSLNNREEFFINYLLEEIKKCNWSHQEKIIIVASGMATSSIGMTELDYARLPVSFDGKGLLAQKRSLNSSSELLLISGARTDEDVMRGEETQAVGLGDDLPPEKKGRLILPGTHSKHLTFDSGYFIDILSFMTGEVFDLLVNKSILHSNVLPADWNPAYKNSFLHGVKKGLESNLLSSLFAIRAKNLIRKNGPGENYYYLSGLLIGSEMSTLQNQTDLVFLAASGIAYKLYKLALESFLPTGQLECIAPSLVDKSVLIGQKKILDKYV